MSTNLQLKPLLPFLFILFLMGGTYAFAYLHPLSWENLRQFNSSLKSFDEHHPLITPLLFIVIYILYALLSLPGIFILSLIAGFLFIQPFSTLYVTFSATIGASLLFLASRTAFGALFYRRSAPVLDRFEKGIRENAASYLLFLRLIPFFPFSIVNLAGAFFGVPFWIFVWTTFVGMIPSVFIYTQAGRGFSFLLEQSRPLSPIHLFNFHLIIALIGLALLALLPALFNSIKAK
jgi:uncharacterized membrane protein YdjX (TVP38/TMEM64 family)